MLIPSVFLMQIMAASAVQETCCTLVGSGVAEQYRTHAIAERRFSHADLWDAVLPYDGEGGVAVREVGRSVQERPIRAVTFGKGSTPVLLWSQMHGDESTATMALTDVIRYFAEGDDDLRTLIADRLTVTMVPMLNPDGAEVFRRHNAVGVDINRDARRLATPEAQTLKHLRDSIAPAFGFNLHDQSARNSAGAGGEPVAIALLAPAADSARSYGPVRTRARSLAALLATGLNSAIPGRVAKYDDAFNPRAFGDLIQQWGTSTVLIESGALPDDPEKQELRALNVQLILTALEAIATGRYVDADTGAYEELPFNESIPADVVVQGGWVVLPGSDPLRLDMALNFEDPVALTGLTLGEVGDLDGVAARDTVDATGAFLHVAMPSTFDPARWRLTRGEPVAITLRRGPTDTSAVLMRLPE